MLTSQACRSTLPTLRSAVRTNNVRSSASAVRSVGARTFASETPRPTTTYSATRGLGATVAGGAAASALYSYLNTPVQLESPTPSATLGKDQENCTFFADPATGVVFPKRSALVEGLLPNGHGEEQPIELDLLGTGPRAVSFLRVRVYVAGMYTDVTAATKAIQAAKLPDHATLEQRMATVLDAGIPVAVRIVPVRSTDFAHIRGGLLRAAAARADQVAAAAPGADDVDTEEEMRAAQDLAIFKSLFAVKRSKFHKSHTLDLLFHRMSAPDGKPITGLTVAHDGEIFGTMVPAAKVNPITSNLVLSYVADGTVPSPPLRDAVGESFDHIRAVS